MKHTKGNWYYFWNGYYFEVKTQDSEKCLNVYTFEVRAKDHPDFTEDMLISHEEAEANAKLISAAPDLLEAAIAIIANADDRIMHLDYEGITDEHYAMLKAAIAKATI